MDPILYLIVFGYIGKKLYDATFPKDEEAPKKDLTAVLNQRVSRLSDRVADLEERLGGLGNVVDRLHKSRLEEVAEANRRRLEPSPQQSQAVSAPSAKSEFKQPAKAAAEGIPAKPLSDATPKLAEESLSNTFNQLDPANSKKVDEPTEEAFIPETAEPDASDQLPVEPLVGEIGRAAPLLSTKPSLSEAIAFGLSRIPAKFLSLAASRLPVAGLWFSAAVMLKLDHSGLVLPTILFLYIMNGLTAYRALFRTDNNRDLQTAGVATFTVSWLWMTSFSASQLWGGLALFTLNPLFFGAWGIYAYKKGLSTAPFEHISCTTAVAGLTFPLYTLLFSEVSIAPIPVFVFIILMMSITTFAVFRNRSLNAFHITGGAVSFLYLILWAAFYVSQSVVAGSLAFILFPAFYIGSFALANSRNLEEPVFKRAAGLAPLLSMGFCFFLLGNKELAAMPWLGTAILAAFNIALGIQSLKNSYFLSYFSVGAAASFVILWAWAFPNLYPGGVITSITMFLIFSGLYIYFFVRARKDKYSPGGFLIPSVTFPLVAISLPAYMLGFSDLGSQPLLVLTVLLVFDLLVTFHTLITDEAKPYHLTASAVTFLTLFTWTTRYLDEVTLPYSFVFFTIFAIVHAGLPILLQRIRHSSAPYNLAHIFAPLMLLLAAYPVLVKSMFHPSIWILVFALNAIGLFATWITASTWISAAMLIITMGTLGGWGVQISSPAELTFFLVIGFFFSLGFQLWFNLSEQKVRTAAGESVPLPLSRLKSFVLNTNLQSYDHYETMPAAYTLQDAMLPALSGFLPFALIVVAISNIGSMPDPSNVFGFAIVMVLMLLRLVYIFHLGILATVTFIGTVMTLIMWHSQHFSADSTQLIPLGWYLMFFLLFFVFPFKFKEKIGHVNELWHLAVSSGLVIFPLVYAARGAFPLAQVAGLIPVLVAVPYILASRYMVFSNSENRPPRTPFQNLFLGCSMLFLTVAIPIQFQLEMLTIGLAVLGSFLIWLFTKVPNLLVKIWGTALLMTAFARLALNPWLFAYYPVSATPLLNWYLYSFLISIAAMVFAGHNSEPPRNRLFGLEIRDTFYVLGIILTFLLLNIQIAAIFSETGYVQLFKISQNLNEKLAYSIGWIIFAVGLLIPGIFIGKRIARLGSLVLMLLAVFKVFLYDLSGLQGLYQVAALGGLAASLMVVSFLYQKYILPKETRLLDHDKT